MQFILLWILMMIFRGGDLGVLYYILILKKLIMEKEMVENLFLGLSVNLIYDIIKYLVILIIFWWFSFLWYKSYNKNITIWDKSEVKKSFKSKVNQDINIWKWAIIDDSFNP